MEIFYKIPELVFSLPLPVFYFVAIGLVGGGLWLSIHILKSKHLAYFLVSFLIVVFLWFGDLSRGFQTEWENFPIGWALFIVIFYVWDWLYSKLERPQKILMIKTGKVFSGKRHLYVLFFAGLFLFIFGISRSAHLIPSIVVLVVSGSLFFFISMKNLKRQVTAGKPRQIDPKTRTGFIISLLFLLPLLTYYLEGYLATSPFIFVLAAGICFGATAAYVYVELKYKTKFLTDKYL